MADTGFWLRVLGHLEVRRDGVLVGPGASATRPRALLTILALDANHVLSKDALIDRLWSTPPPTARNLIEKNVAIWRRVLDDTRLETVGRGYRLNLRDEECDLLLARRHLARGRDAVRAQEWSAAAAQLAAAVHEWSPGFQDALHDVIPVAEVRNLSEMHLTTVEEWAHAVMRGEGPRDELIEVLGEQLGAHPLRERLAEMLMWALSGNGDQQGAVECYERIRQALADELGQDPGESLRRMHLRILRQDTELRPRSPGRSIDNLLPRNGRFVGRSAELDAVESGLARRDGSAGRRVALWGLVGAGKSTLALEFAYRHRAAYECIWWVDATDEVTLPAALESLADRYGCSLPAQRQPNLDQLWQRLIDLTGVLLVFDNAASAGQLRGYLPPAPIDVLITSLNPDWRQLAELVPVDMMTPSDARDLLRVGVGDDVEVDTELISALGRLPLAISQAAGYIVQTGMDSRHYLQLFRRRRAQLLRRGAPDDHRGTIETTWRLAHAELSASDPAAVQLLALCSVLAPEIIPLRLITARPELLPRELAAAAVDELEFEDAILQLRRYSLMSRDNEHVQVHCLVQAVVANALAAGELDRSIRCAAGLLRRAAPTGYESRGTWREWEPLIPHIREITRSARNATRVDAEFVELTHDAVGYLSTRGQSWEALDLMRDSHALVETNVADADDRAMGRSLTMLGEAFEQCALLRQAIDTQEAAIKALQAGSTPEDPWLVRALGGLGRVLTCHAGISLWKPAELEEAEQRFVTALRILGPALGERNPIVAKLHGALGQVRQDRGDLAGALRCFRKALDIAETTLETGHPEIGHCHDRLAYVLALTGEAEGSLRSYDRAAELLAESYGPEHPWVAWSLSNRAMLLLSLDRTAEALTAQNSAHHIFLGDAEEHPAAVAISAWRLARIQAARRRPDLACELLEPAISSARELLGPDHGDVMAMRADLATFRGATGG